MALSIDDITNRINSITDAQLLEVNESFVVKHKTETYYLERITSYREGTEPIVVWRFSTSITRERYLVSQEQYDKLETLVGPLRPK